MLRHGDRVQGGLTGIALCQVQQTTVARNACGVFGALPGLVCSIHRLDPQGHAQGIAQALAMVLKCHGGCLQPVIDMERHHLARPLPRAQHQQRAGIRTTTQSNTQWQGRVKGPHRLGER